MLSTNSRQFIVISSSYTLKGSKTARILFNLQTRRKYSLDDEQAEFLELCDGTRRLEEILAVYDEESQAVIVEYLGSLMEINAIHFHSEPSPRQFVLPVDDPHLQSVHFEFTSRCNMRCRHCYQESYLRRTDDLTLKEITQLAEELQALNVEIIGLSGGEPFESRDVFDVIDIMEAHEISISSILTNGLRLNNEVVERLKRGQSQPTIFISLDGLRTDAMRIRGFSEHRHGRVFDRLVRNIQMVVDAGMPVMINTVVTSDNVQDLPEMYNWLRRIGVKGWRVALPKFAGAYPVNAVQFALQRAEVFRAYQKVIIAHLASGGVESGFRLQIEHFFRLEVFGNLTLLPPDSFVCDYEGKLQSICVKPNGDVTPCPLYVDLVLGNIRKQALGTIWYSEEMRKIKEIRICEVRACTGCKFAPLCATGCRANSIFLHGQIDDVDDDACAAVQFFLEEIVPVLRERGIVIPEL